MTIIKIVWILKNTEYSKGMHLLTLRLGFVIILNICNVEHHDISLFHNVLLIFLQTLELTYPYDKTLKIPKWKSGLISHITQKLTEKQQKYKNNHFCFN